MLYKFEDMIHFLDKDELNLLWQYLKENSLKLKDVTFKLLYCPIGTSIRLCDSDGAELSDLTDYASW